MNQLEMWVTYLISLCFLWMGANRQPLSSFPADRVLLPVEILGEDGAIGERQLNLPENRYKTVRSLWLEVHGVRYPEQASVQINQSSWIPLRNDTASVEEPGKSFGGIGGGFATLRVTIAIPENTVSAGVNIVRFRFNRSDGLASGYRVLALNFLSNDGNRILPSTDFVEDSPDSWLPPLNDVDSIRAGKELWLSAPLVASSIQHRPIQAHCADCHAHDGRDLKYFNFSNDSIVSRSQFHGLTKLQGEKIASYIRSLPFLNPGTPWNPPYQPGPNLYQLPVSRWSSGAGLGWVLDHDTSGLPYFLGDLAKGPQESQSAFPALAALTRNSSNVFRPDGNLDARLIPIALQLPDWSQWLPRVHPKDAWGEKFTRSRFAWMYDGRAEDKNRGGHELSVRALLEAKRDPQIDTGELAMAFSRWQRSRRTFLNRRVGRKSPWTREFAEKVYSTQLWQLVKTWEVTQEFSLEGPAHAPIGSTPGSGYWRNTIPQDAAPAAAGIPNGPAGVGGSALTNEYLSSAWYELQVVINNGNHQHRDRTPIDWIYLISGFRKLNDLSHQPEPVRLLVAITKALQSTDPRLGPEDTSRGWRPDRTIDPRIMIDPNWASIFAPLPADLKRALTESLLSAWMDKNLQYPIARYLPLHTVQNEYKSHGHYTDISGGKAWEAAQQFRAAGVSDALVARLQTWGTAYTDRAARILYH